MKDITSLALGCTFFYEALMPHKATLYHPIQIQHLNNAKNKCTAAQVSCYHINKSNGFAQQNNIKWDLQSICLRRCLKYLLPSEGIFQIFCLSMADFTFCQQIIFKKKSDHFQQFFSSMKMSFFLHSHAPKGGFFSESSIQFLNLQISKKKKMIPKNYPELEI